ncbi:MAG: glycosyltransferase family 2 protein [Pseudomonadota bacterium]
MMGTLKSLVQLNNRLERTWSVYDLDDSNQLRAGWHVIEFTVAELIDHVPRLVISDSELGEKNVFLDGYHAGRNRILLYLPAEELLGMSESINLSRFARLSGLEGRARLALVCLRYLVDFPSVKTLLTIIGLALQDFEAQSKTISQFYANGNKSVGELEQYHWWYAWAPLIRWWYRNTKLGVIIASDTQRSRLANLVFPPDLVAHKDAAGEIENLLKKTDYLLVLQPTENLLEGAVLTFKRFVRRQSQPRATLIYSDHSYDLPNTVDAHLRMPRFKPDPSAPYLYCYDYFQFACFFKSSAMDSNSVRTVGDDTERYYFCLSLINEKDKTTHLPEVLIKSNRELVQSTPPPLTSESPWPGLNWQRTGAHNQLVCTHVEGDPAVDLVIPTRDGLDILKPCVESILNKTDYRKFHVYIVDNGSEKPETLAFFDQITTHEQVSIVSYPGEFNYSAINNFAVAQGSGDYIGLINNDIEVIGGDWLTQMLGWAVQPNVGVVGAKLLFGNGLVQHAGVVIGMGNAAGHIHRLEAGDSPGYENRCIATQNMMAVTAACLLTPRSLYESLGGLDEEHLKVAYNDVDYCLRVEAAGHDVIWTPEATLYHHESVSRGDDMSDKHIERYFRELRVFQKRWNSKGFVDKFYSKHLRVTDEGVYPQITSNQKDQLVLFG